MYLAPFLSTVRANKSLPNHIINNFTTTFSTGLSLRSTVDRCPYCDQINSPKERKVSYLSGTRGLWLHFSDFTVTIKYPSPTAIQKHNYFIFVTLVTRQLTVFSHDENAPNASLWFMWAGSRSGSWVICTSWEVQLGTSVFSRTTNRSPSTRWSWEQMQNAQCRWTPHRLGAALCQVPLTRQLRSQWVPPPSSAILHSHLMAQVSVCFPVKWGY